MNCAKCQAPMEPFKYGKGDRLVHRCTSCGGIWLKPQDMARLKNTYMADIIDEGSPSVGRKHNKLEDIDCPMCGTKMDKVADDEQTHIWYESCPEGHGMYLDAGELTDYNNDTISDFFKGLFAGRRA